MKKLNRYVPYKAVAATVHTLMIDHPELKPRAILVGSALAMHHPDVRPSQARLARLTHLSRETVRQALNDLRDAGLIDWTVREQKSCARYCLRWLESPE